MQVNKAIIAVAGNGTRRLPITLAVEKSMLPILNRPVVDYVVEDCTKAGITEICFVVNPGSSQIQTYFDRQSDVYSGVTFSFVEEDNDGKYGTTKPLHVAQDFVQGEDHFVFMGGDDFVFNHDGSSELRRLMDMLEQTHQSAGLMAAEVPNEQVSSYGCIELGEDSSYKGIVEKPSSEEAPSNLINISKYVLTPDILTYVNKQIAEPLGNDRSEYQITDVLNSYTADGGNIYVHTIMGTYLDGGEVTRWLNANNFVASHQN